MYRFNAPGDRLSTMGVICQKSIPRSSHTILARRAVGIKVVHKNTVAIPCNRSGLEDGLAEKGLYHNVSSRRCRVAP